MADLLSRVGLLLVSVALLVPPEWSDTLGDALGLALGAYVVVLAAFVGAQLFDVHPFREKSDE